MTFRNPLEDPGVLIRLGALFLLLASLWKWFVHPGGRLSGGAIEGGTGLLYGLSIGCFLLGIRRNRVRRRMDDGPRA